MSTATSWPWPPHAQATQIRNCGLRVEQRGLSPAHRRHYAYTTVKHFQLFDDQIHYEIHTNSTNENNDDIQRPETNTGMHHSDVKSLKIL